MEEKLREIENALRTVKDYVDYPWSHNGTTKIDKAVRRGLEVIKELKDELSTENKNI